ncbi:hypothetical protein PE067_04395 [Paracoccus sp. DMF-8]|uniref:hypothetical protein n=1 Tax=Paracoccus sp. DMF-8 TaxID=3019445 RepID=UPI0023E8A191|nr:hypothetical protein [Paracoccus sp. DMF-8]MDF3605458.1 hypothetical protein [Paracoccus sp. DMF-8]
MTDEHLTDHEWKLKMASEGRAFYIPGKTTAQMKAEQAERAESVTLMISAEQAAALISATGNIPYLLHHCCRRLWNISEVTTSMGHIDDNTMIALTAITGASHEGSV